MILVFRLGEKRLRCGKAERFMSPITVSLARYAQNANHSDARDVVSLRSYQCHADYSFSSVSSLSRSKTTSREPSGQAIFSQLHRY
jgi:hypothetical protein